MIKKLCIILVAITFLFNFSACGKEEVRQGWLLGVPSYSGGEISLKAYDIGVGVDFNYGTSTGSLQTVTQTNREEFDSYIKKVKKAGYKQTAINEVANNVFVQYAKGGKILYAYYVDSLKQARIIEDFASTPETDFEYEYTPKTGENAVVYQYALMNDPLGFGNGSSSNGKYTDCGMFYIIHLADNSLILVDGGAGSQATDKAMQELVKFLYEITGLEDTQKIRVASIIISHAHSDHKAFIHKLVDDYSENFIIERAMYNIPATYSSVSSGESFKAFGSALIEKYSDIKFMKTHTGQSISLGGAVIDVITCHEDYADPKYGYDRTDNFNNTTTVYKVTANGKSFMMLGDWGGGNGTPSMYERQGEILATYKNQDGTYPYLKADVVQVAHHILDTWMWDLYNAIGAKIAFVPQTDIHMETIGLKDTIVRGWDELTMWCGLREFYFQSRNTYYVEFDSQQQITIKSTPIRGADDEYLELISNYEPFKNN